MHTSATRGRRALAPSVALTALALFGIAGCKPPEDTPAALTRAIDTYYTTHPTCLFNDPVKFPVQADTSDAKQTAQWDALVDQGLLVRTTAEKKVLIIASKEVNNYDLSDKGRQAWTPDPQQPGYGNFCYGHRKVLSIDSSSDVTNQRGATTDVVYRYTVPDATAWARAEETQTAYPDLQADLAGDQVGRATLTNLPHKGWRVTSAPWGHISDSKIMQ